MRNAPEARSFVELAEREDLVWAPARRDGVFGDY